MFDSTYIQEDILYRNTADGYYFFYFNLRKAYEDNLPVYLLEYVEGKVGEIPDSEYLEEKDAEKMIRNLQELLKPYSKRNLPFETVTVEIRTADIILNLPPHRVLDLYHHITRTIDFVSYSSGLGIRNFHPMLLLDFLDKLVYETTVTVLNLHPFKKLLIEQLEVCGIKAEEINVEPIANR